MKIFSSNWVTRLLNNTFFKNGTKTKVQTKILASSISGAGFSEISAMTFNNLEIDKWYRVSLQVFADEVNQGDGNAAGFEYHHNGVRICSNWIFVPASPNGAKGTIRSGSSMPFKAETTTLQAFKDIAGIGQIYGDGTKANTYAVLEELPNHEETTDFS